MNTLSFEARAALTAFKIDRNEERLKKTLRSTDYEAQTERGETLLDIAYRLGHRHTIVVLEGLWAYRAHRGE